MFQVFVSAFRNVLHAFENIVNIGYSLLRMLEMLTLEVMDVEKILP